MIIFEYQKKSMYCNKYIDCLICLLYFSTYYQHLIGYLMLRFDTNNLLTVIRFKVLLSNINNCFMAIWF